MKADAKTRAEIMKTIREMWTAYSHRDIEEVLSFYAPDADMVVLGSGPDEKYVGAKEARKGLQRDFSQSESAKVKLSNIRISAAGKIAWLVADCLFKARVAQGEMSMAGRLTAVLEKRRGRWLIVQSHFSMPYLEQAVGQSFPQK